MKDKLLIVLSDLNTQKQLVNQLEHKLSQQRDQTTIKIKQLEHNLSQQRDQNKIKINQILIDFQKAKNIRHSTDLNKVQDDITTVTWRLANTTQLLSDNTQLLSDR